MGQALVFIEHDGTEIKTQARNAITAGSKLGDVVAVVAGYNVDHIAKAASVISGVKKVVVADDEVFSFALAEPLADLLVHLAPSYSHIIAASTAIGKSIIPRAAGLLDVQPISEVIGIIDANTFVRPIYAGNANATVRSSDTRKLMTVRATSFDPAPPDGATAPIEVFDVAIANTKSRFVSAEVPKNERPELTAARVIVSGGRGLQNGENFRKLIYPIADKLCAAVGASRAAVDAGFVPNDYQVGQTGKIVAPDLYVAIGISGAIQHLAGMKDSKIIVAINKDEDAPIFQVADYGMVGDLFSILPELDRELDCLA